MMQNYLNNNDKITDIKRYSASQILKSYLKRIILFLENITLQMGKIVQ
jgi:hypothetical protein